MKVRFVSMLFALCAICCVATETLGADQTARHELQNKLQTISVTIDVGGSQGSGVVFARNGRSYVWTAAHVVDGLRSTRTVIDSKTGTERKIVEFKDARVMQLLIEDGQTVGRHLLDAEVIRYSDADNGEDLALLLVRKKDYIRETVQFYLDKDLIPLGTRLLHVGSLLGEDGANSVTDGIMSQHGRKLSINKKVFDQTTVVAFPGSSGGGVFLEDGRYIGMLVRGAGEGFNLIVPIRRMREWAERAGVSWAIDHNVKMPSDEELDKMPVEDIGVSFSRDTAAKAPEPTPATPAGFGSLLIHRK